MSASEQTTRSVTKEKDCLFSSKTWEEEEEEDDGDDDGGEDTKIVVTSMALIVHVHSTVSWPLGFMKAMSLRTIEYSCSSIDLSFMEITYINMEITYENQK